MNPWCLTLAAPEQKCLHEVNVSVSNIKHGLYVAPTAIPTTYKSKERKKESKDLREPLGLRVVHHLVNVALAHCEPTANHINNIMLEQPSGFAEIIIGTNPNIHGLIQIIISAKFYKKAHQLTLQKSFIRLRRLQHYTVQ